MQCRYRNPAFGQIILLFIIFYQCFKLDLLNFNLLICSSSVTFVYFKTLLGLFHVVSFIGVVIG